MANIKFNPDDVSISIDTPTKLLLVGKKAGVEIRFGCGACRCGLCAVAVSGSGQLSELKDLEKNLLERIKLPSDGSIRLACQAKSDSGDVEIDLSFQNKYSPDAGLDD